MSGPESVKKYFESALTDYDSCCSRVVPRNSQLQKVLAHSIPLASSGRPKMLDIGFGTGLTAMNVLGRFPGASILGIDFSSKMLAQAAKRMAAFEGRVRLLNQDVTKYEPNDGFDVVYSAIAIHNLSHKQKQELFAKICRCLNKGGCFVNADFISFGSAYMQASVNEFYEAFLKRNLSGKSLEHWLAHAKEQDMPATLKDQFSWLEQAGFSSVECVWLYRNLAVYVALK